MVFEGNSGVLYIRCAIRLWAMTACAAISAGLVSWLSCNGYVLFYSLVSLVSSVFLVFLVTLVSLESGV